MSLDDLLDRTRTVDPPAESTLMHGRTEVLAALDASLVRQARIVRRRRHRRIALGAVAAASATVIGVGILTTNGTTPPTAGHRPDGGAKPPVVTRHFTTVAQVTRAAGAAPGTELGSAPYWKVVTDYRSSSCTETVCSPFDGHRTAWAGIDRPGVIEDTQFGPGDRPSLPAATVTIGGQQMSWAAANGRTWTPAQLAGLVADGGGDKPGRAPSSWYVFKNTGDLLAESPASPAIRKELWHLLGRVPGVRLAGDVTDHQGRHGWELTLSNPTYGTQSYIVDPETGSLLEGRVRLAGAKPTWATYLSAGPASTAPAATE